MRSALRRMPSSVSRVVPSVTQGSEACIICAQASASASRSGRMTVSALEAIRGVCHALTLDSATRYDPGPACISKNKSRSHAMSRIDRVEVHEFAFELPDLGMDTGGFNIVYQRGNRL